MKLQKFLEKKGYHAIYLATIPSGHHVLPAKINKKEGLFLLDTGASNTCINASKIKKYKLKSKETKHKATGAGTMEIDIQTAKKVSVKLNDWKIKNLEVVIMDMEHINTALSIFDIKVDGIIGADILNAGKAVIAYDKDMLYLK